MKAILSRFNISVVAVALLAASVYAQVNRPVQARSAKPGPGSSTAAPASRVPLARPSAPAVPTKPPVGRPGQPSQPSQQFGSVKRGSIDYSAKQKLESIQGVKMIAATSDTQPAVVVLKWIVDEQWLPSQGFNLYRKGPGEGTWTKIAGPIKQKQLGTMTLPDATGAMRQVDMSGLQNKAAAPVNVSGSPQHIFVMRQGTVASSRPVFDEMKSLKQKLYTPYSSNTRQTFQRVDAASFSKLVTYYQRFNPDFGIQPAKYKSGLRSSAPKLVPTRPAQPNAAPTRKLNLTNSEKVASGKYDMQKMQTPADARRTLLLGAMVNSDVSSGLGLQYTDANVKPGETYEYQIRQIADNGNESPAAAANCTITVGADPLPATPTGLAACQTGVKKVELRWDLDTVQSSARVIIYDIYRLVGGQRKQINSQPVAIGPVMDKQGHLTDMITYFTDKNAPLGSVTYELVGRDTFGRKAQSATADVNVADVETPNPAAKTHCTVYNGAVYVSWPQSRKTPQASAQSNQPSGLHAAANVITTTFDTEAVYNVWRCDSEASPRAWTRLNSSPLTYVKPTAVIVSNNGKPSSAGFVDTTVQKDHYYLYRVTALYVRNMLESDPSPEEQAAVPDLAKPAALANLASKFVSAASKSASGLRFDQRFVRKATVLTAAPARVRNLHKQASDWKYFKSGAVNMSGTTAHASAANRPTMTSNASPVSAGLSISVPGMSATYVGQLSTMEKNISQFITATPDNSALGGRVELTWNPAPLKAPVRYMVFRADGTGYGLVSAAGLAANLTTTAASANAVRKISTSSAGEHAAVSMNQSHVLQMNSASAKNVKLVKTGFQRNISATLDVNGNKFEYFKFIDPDVLPDRAWTFMEEATKPSFADSLPKSRPVYYHYRVVAVNRWGVDGTAKTISVRVPATIPPPTPEFKSAAPNLDGGITLRWKALDNKEECAKYLVYRKPVDFSSIVGNLTFDVVSENTNRGTSGSSPWRSLAMGVASTPTAHATASQNNYTNTAASTSGVVHLNASTTRKLSADLVEKPVKYGVQDKANIPIMGAQSMMKMREILRKPDGYSAVAEVDANNVDQDGMVIFNDTKDLVANQFYSYTIVAEDVDEWRSESSDPLIASPFRIKAEPVRNLKTTMHASQRGVILSWDIPLVAAPHKIIGYFIKRAKAGSTDFLQVSEQIYEPKWTDFGILRGPSYTYQVYSMDETGNLSDPVSIDFTAPQ